MSYSLYYSCQDHSEEFDNITLNTILNNSELSEDSSKESENSFEELSESLFPIYNYIHVLQEEPSEEDILDIYENAPNITIIHIPSFDKYFIALNACGSDFSDSIAYAYMVIDYDIPKSFQSPDRLSLSEESFKKVIEFKK